MIEVIGFHGTLDLEETPGHHEPVLAREGWLVGPDGEQGERVPARGLPGDGTRLPRPLRHRPGWLFLVLGDADVALFGGLRPSEVIVIDAIQERPTAKAEAVTLDGALHAVYVEPATAADLWSVLRSRIRDELEKAARHSGVELEAAAWRLQRVAQTSEESLLALAGLKLAGAPEWREAAEALFPRTPWATLDAGIAKWAADLAPPHRSKGALLRVRDQVRAKEAA